MKRAATSSPKGAPPKKCNRDKYIASFSKSSLCDLKGTADLESVDLICEFEGREDCKEDGVMELYLTKFETMPGFVAQVFAKRMIREIKQRDEWKMIKRSCEHWVHSSDSSDTSDEE